ncbi:adenylate kinase [Acetivibrio cellulolyticus]|uniref:adenylate kinase n=1 Tax=Acetivibrio cellulolyticus TaxID=35830 RepID=UPI0001E2D4BC|nr:adenylate kinase [Acetivibrio cellulolyticus]
MKVVLLGAPGSGKGTQAVNISEWYKIPHISTGDIFRSNIKNGTELGKKAKEYIDKGLLVPDEVTIDIVSDRLKQSDCEKGFILDGFPRTVYQAEKLDEILNEMGATLDVVLNIEVPDSEIITRMGGRRVCTKCGMSYHVVFNPPAEGNVCKNCGEVVIQREDDREETVLQRLSTYHKQTEPLIEYYEKDNKLVTVEGQDNIDDTTSCVKKALGGM